MKGLDNQLNKYRTTIDELFSSFQDQMKELSLSEKELSRQYKMDHANAKQEVETMLSKLLTALEKINAIENSNVHFCKRRVAPR